MYLYRYVFTKGVQSDQPFIGLNTEGIPDREVAGYAARILRDRTDDRYRANTLYQDLLLWIGRECQRWGVEYVEIADTALLNREAFPARLRQIHEIMPAVTRETGVLIRFLAGIRRIPLTIVRDRVTPNDYLAENLRYLRTIAADPYVAGGSFNNSSHRTALRAGDRAFIDALLARLDPARVFFAVGHTLTGQEGYLVRQAAGRFRVFAFVPTMVSRGELNRLRAAEVGVRLSIESSGMGLYKSFAYEIFKHRPSALLAFDGNSAALNLIQEARNARHKCRIYINPKSRGLAAKAKLLEGYVSPLGEGTIGELGIRN